MAIKAIILLIYMNKMQYYYVYNRNEQLHKCIAQYLKQIDKDIQLVAIHDNEGQQRLTDFLKTAESYAFLLPLVITLCENTRKVMSTQEMYDWISTKRQRAEQYIGNVAHDQLKRQCVESTIHPTILHILSSNQKPPQATEVVIDTVPSSSSSGVIDDNTAHHWDNYSSVASTTNAKDPTARVSISDALQNGKQREVGVSPMAQATRR